jgi:hypothetical protein
VDRSCRLTLDRDADHHCEPRTGLLGDQVEQANATAASAIEGSRRDSAAHGVHAPSRLEELRRREQDAEHREDASTTTSFMTKASYPVFRVCAR